MFRELLFRIKHRIFIQHPEGKKQFANWAQTTVIRKMQGPLQKLQSAVRHSKAGCVDIDRILSDKEKKLCDLGLSPSQSDKPPLAAEEQELHVRKARFNFWCVFLLVMAEAALNFISMLILITEEGIQYDAVRIVLAFIVTAVAVFVFDRVWISWREQKGRMGLPAAICWSIGGISVLFLLYAFSSARARDFEVGTKDIIYYGFIILSLVLPVVAGWMWADRELILPGYRRLMRWKQTIKEIRNFERKRDRLAEEILKRFGDFRTDFDKLISDYWMVVNYFNTVKDGCNVRHNPPMTENIAGSPAENIDQFKKEPIKWCEGLVDPLKKELAQVSITIP